MTTLKKSVNQKSQTAKSTGPKKNPEIDALIDKYIKENPKRISYLKTESKDQLIRRAILPQVRKEQAISNYRQTEAAGIQNFLKENPDIAQDVEKRISRVPDDRKEAARLNLGRQAATKAALKI